MTANAFDHSHEAWDALLKEHVTWLPGGHATLVDYAGLQKDQTQLEAYLDSLSGVTMKSFASWQPQRQLAFLINAYNAYTVALVLTRYPDLVSIKDIGSLFKSAWKKRFFTLLGEERTLDDLEHEMIREPGRFDEARIHFAVNCASIGCPALRDEAYTAEKLDQQLNDQVQRFVGDTSRNYSEAARNIAHLSSIFDWYEDDFSLGPYDSVVGFLRSFGDSLDPSLRAIIDSERPRIRYSDYDWSLNDVSANR